MKVQRRAILTFWGRSSLKTIADFPGTGSRFLTTIRYMRKPYECYRQWKDKFGDTFMVNALNGSVLATGNAQNIQLALAATTDEVKQFATETSSPLVGPTSVLLIDGPRHKQERRILSRSFAGHCVASQANNILEVAERAADRWNVGETILVMDEALNVSLDVITRVVFGVADVALMKQYRVQIKKFVSSFHPVLAFTRMSHRSWLGLSPWVRFQKEKRALEEMLDREIDQATARPTDSEGMLGRILQEYIEQDGEVDRANVRSQLITLLLAGHETTQIAIAWAMSWLHRGPADYVDQLRSEIAEKDFLTVVRKSELLDGICNETLRLNPILPDVVRTLKTPLCWSGVELPVGTNIALSTCMVHEDESIYPDPALFDPKRWFEFRPKPHQFLPFGGGVRRCIGAPLSIIELKIVILSWLRRFEFELPEHAPKVEAVKRRNITMAPASGVPLKISRALQ